MKEGTIVRCIESMEDWDITVGNVYVVQRAAGFSVVVVTDTGDRLWYNTERFKIIIEP